jgi:hypothetical protein
MHKNTWPAADGKTHNQINHVLVDRRHHSSRLDVGLFRVADCSTDRCLVVVKVKERLAVSRRAVKKMDMERLNFKELVEGEVKVQYQATIKNKFAALENLEDNGAINMAWDTIRENIKILTKGSIGQCESKHHKPWFDEECLNLLMKEAG